MYTALGIFFLAIGLGLIGILAYLIFIKKAIIDKKSLFYALPVFLLVYAMYLTGTVYNGEAIDFHLLFALTHKTLGVFAMDFDYSLFSSIIKQYPVFDAAIIVACVLTFVTVVFGVFAIFDQKISNAIRKSKNFSLGCDLLIGYSKDSLEYLKRNKNTVLWAEEIDKSVYAELIKDGYTVCKAPLDAHKVVKALKSKEHHIIAFRDSGYSYTELISLFEKIKSEEDRRIYLHLEATVDEMSIVQKKYLSELSTKSNSFITSFCRYELMARSFIASHPISKYIPRDFLNKNLTLKNDKDINIVFVGFGKVNCELFKLMATQFQFARKDEAGLCTAPVRYYIFENDAKQLNNATLIKIQNEYDEIFSNSDLPPAEKICDVIKTEPIDANSAQARKELFSLVNEDSYTYFIVSLANDFTNATFAHGIKDLLGDKKNYKIFVRAKENDNKLLNKGEQNIVYFGDVSDMWSHDVIVNDDLWLLSQNVNDLYNDTYKSYVEKYREWQCLPIIEQQSNLSAALSIYFKLNLMGFDLKKNSEDRIDKAEFMARYPDAFMGEKEPNYQYFFGDSTANVLAFIEHSRWNAQYILSGYKPLPFDKFEWVEKKSKSSDITYTLSHKNAPARRHACLTTYIGLDKLIEYKLARLSEESKMGKKKVVGNDKDSLAAIYRYDYMVTDGMYDALERLGYSIIDDTDSKK